MNSLTADFGLFHIDIHFPGKENDEKKTTLNKIAQVALNAIAATVVTTTNVVSLTCSFVKTSVSFISLVTTTAFTACLVAAQTVVACYLLAIGFIFFIPVMPILLFAELSYGWTN